MLQRKHYDVVIVGGGMVGLCLALAVKDFLRVAIVEAHVFIKKEPDLRALALAHSSQKILEGLGVWPLPDSQNVPLSALATPLHEIHISQGGRFGMTRLRAQESNQEQYGFIVPAHSLGESLLSAVQASSQIDFIAPASIDSFVADSTQAYLKGENINLSSELVIIANGADSTLAKNAGITYKTEDKGQCALVSTVAVSQPTSCIAYERFSQQDIIALLPLGENKYGVVWTSTVSENTLRQDLSEQEFLHTLQKAFGYRVGRFDSLVSARQSYPLRTVIAEKEWAPRAIVMGNAAHTLHPAAGQGLNLALRRMAVLAEELVKARSQKEDLGGEQLMKRYYDRTYKDVKQVAQFTQGLVELFSLDNAFLESIRGLGLFAFDCIKPLKTRFTEQAMGLSMSTSTLTKGMPIS